MRDSCSPSKRLPLVWAAVLLLLLWLVAALAACGGRATMTPDAPASPTIATSPDIRVPAAVSTDVYAQESVELGSISLASPQASAVTPTRTPARKSTASRTPTPTVALSGLPTIKFDRLPVEARETIRLIQDGGPFPYRQDGTVFQNRERVLPGKPNGFYREYTVKTPGSPDRGARRIIAGEKGELYYTDDHYDSFKQVVMP